MVQSQDVKNEERESPSLEPTGDAHEYPSFLVPPPSSGTLDHLKMEGPKQEPLSPLSAPTGIKIEPKTEDEPSPSQSPTLNDELSPLQKFKLSPSPTPPPSTTNGTASMSSTPPPVGIPLTTSKKAQASAVQLIGDLCIAREAAIATFNEIEANSYQYKSLGRSREALESMTCDCTFDPANDDPDDACGHHSDCINRLTQVECLPDDCRCGEHCRNQRFQNRDYANIDIVQTALKGFGLRAESDLQKDTFIYEYVGDVVSPASFKKRMRDYADEGIQHFYFMMLQKDELSLDKFIDATKRGGIGRFANHSCRPNCYVAKWTVGEYVRMGIFAKRNIKKHEELTFNYNVDRYGHQAQVCYCGESNCVGFIGGKTQTDVATMDDLYLDALGITDEADLIELKGTKKKKGKKIDDPDFMPTMKAIVEKDIPKVVQAIRQTQSRKVLLKLLTRIKLTEDQAALRSIMRLRGYSLMTNVLDDHRSDVELINLALSCMSTWPLINRNKVDDSRVIVSVRAIAELEDDKNKEMAQTATGSTLGDSSLVQSNIEAPFIRSEDNDEDINKTRIRLFEGEDEFTVKRVKYGHGDEIDLNRTKWRPKPPPKPRSFPRHSYPDSFHDPGTFRPVPWEHPQEPEPRPPPVDFLRSERETVRAVIAAAAEAEAAKQAQAAQEAKDAEAAAVAKAEAKAARAARHAAKAENRKKTKLQKKVHTEEEKEALKEKRMLKLVGAVVVKSMSKHSKAMDHDQFKKHAKELTQIITDKEKKSSSYKEGRLDKLTDEKAVKIKKFAKEYIAKILRKLEKSSKHPQEPSSNAPTASTSTLHHTEDSNERGGDDIIMGDASMEDMNVVSDSDGDEDGDGDEDREDEAIEDGDGDGDGDGDVITGVDSRSPPKAPLVVEPWGEMDLDEAAEHHAAIQPPSDPRRRPPSDLFESWEPPQGPSGM